MAKRASAKACLFLSHSGADTEAARELKRRLLESPAAKAAKLRIWFDKDDLEPGPGWQEQIEAAITKEATAFAVYVGSKGIVNWVEREVRLGLARATGPGAIVFLPILSADSDGPSALPPFAQQHQGVHDPLGRPEELAKLMDAVLGKRLVAQPLIEEPFVGLRAMTETDAGRFFGRQDEVGELVADLRRHRLLAIVADSGAGKSSLAMAGLIPAFRGGVLADPARRAPDNRLWHVVVMRPGGDPMEGLRRGVTEAAERLKLSPEARAALRARIASDNPSEAAYAIRCDLSAGETETLLIVDQFDELLTETPEARRAPFVDLLIKLAEMKSPGGFYVVLTVRVDYFNLCRPFGTLYEKLAGEKDPAVLRLKRISDKGLTEAVLTPLKLAGHADEAEAEKLAAATRRDLGDRPGDLALAQMALFTVWQARKRHGGSLLRAYVDAGGVSGALAQEAERIRNEKLSPEEQALLPALFVRLVRLGETGGALRRIAPKSEFDPARLALADKLCSDSHGRLLLAGDDTFEVCHEALITQWPWLQNELNRAAADLRVLDRLEEKAPRWQAALPAARAKYIATGYDREQFAELALARDSWLSPIERTFIAASQNAFAQDERRRRWTRRGMIAATLVLALLTILAAWQWREAESQKRIAQEQRAIAETRRKDAEEQTRIAEERKLEAEQSRRLAEAQRQEAERHRQAAEERRREAETQKARAERVLVAASNVANDLVFELALKFRDVSGVPVSVIRDILGKAQALLKQLAETGESTPEMERREAATLALLSDTLLRQGATAEALEAAQRSAQIMEKLAKSDPGNAELQRDLSVSYNKVGEVLAAQGDGAGALASYRQSLVIREKLAKSDPGNAEWQRDLSLSYNRIGDVLVAQGDGAGALASYGQSLAIAEKLAKSDPGNAEWQRDLSVSYEKIGDVLVAQGDNAGALASYRQSLAIREKLAKSDPGNAEWQRDLSVNYNRIGDVLVVQGDGPGGLASYRRSLAIAEKLAKSDLGNAQWQRDLSVSYEKVGNVLADEGDGAGALASYRQSLAIAEKLAKSDPGNAEWQRDLSISYWKLANSGDAPRVNFQKALDILLRLKTEGRLQPVDEQWIKAVEAKLASLPPDSR